MSCFVMNPESVKMIACTMAELYNRVYEVEYFLSLSIGAYFPKMRAETENVFKPLEDVGYTMDSEAFYNALMKLNLRAYNGRYGKEDEEYPLFSDVDSGSIFEPIGGFCNRKEAGEWLYHLAKLLDCYLYQTLEDGTDKDGLRIALVEFNKALKVYIVEHSTTYSKFKWGL